MAYTQQGLLDRSLTDDEEQEFRDYAQIHDPEDLSKWTVYHPVCRQEWLKRGIQPTVISRFRGYVDDHGAVDA